MVGLYTASPAPVQERVYKMTVIQCSNTVLTGRRSGLVTVNDNIPQIDCVDCVVTLHYLYMLRNVRYVTLAGDRLLTLREL